MSKKHQYDIAQLSQPPQPRGPYIRDTNITVDEVFRVLASKRLSDEAVLDEYPALKPEDIPFVRESIRKEIESRDHDEITGRPILPKDHLLDGRYYKGRCRNATVARWNASANCFYHWREKFGNVYIERIKYPTDEAEPWWDVFNPVEELTNPKSDIPLDKSAEFKGNPDDLTEFDEEMWRGWKDRLRTGGSNEK
jgi:uncharacterized protein (DUF433 family)